jgi:hypothetical protein
MAKLKGNVQFEGTLDDFVAYTREDIEGIIVQRKGGPTRRQVKKGENYRLTRKNNREFGGRSYFFSLMNGLLIHLKSCTGYNISYAINSLLKPVQEMDTEGELGRRKISLGAATQYLEGFQLSNKNSLESICMNPINLEMDRASLTATIRIPVLKQGKNFSPPGDFQYYRWVFVLGLVPDLLFDEGMDDYVPAFQPLYPCIAQGEWQEVASTVGETEFELAIPAAPPNEQYALVLAGGIMFGTIKSGIIMPVKRKGGGKILRVM